VKWQVFIPFNFPHSDEVYTGARNIDKAAGGSAHVDEKDFDDRRTKFSFKSTHGSLNSLYSGITAGSSGPNLQYVGD
jgi:hypothetical protein